MRDNLEEDECQLLALVRTWALRHWQNSISSIFVSSFLQGSASTMELYRGNGYVDSYPWDRKSKFRSMRQKVQIQIHDADNCQIDACLQPNILYWFPAHFKHMTNQGNFSGKKTMDQGAISSSNTNWQVHEKEKAVIASVHISVTFQHLRNANLFRSQNMDRYIYKKKKTVLNVTSWDSHWWSTFNKNWRQTDKSLN